MAVPGSDTTVVWFKRDLRVSDHAPLTAAAARGPVICLYVVEPMLLEQAETDASHFQFIAECLAELRDGLATRGARLLIRRGEVTTVLSDLHRVARFQQALMRDNVAMRTIVQDDAIAPRSEAVAHYRYTRTTTTTPRMARDAPADVATAGRIVGIVVDARTLPTHTTRTGCEVGKGPIATYFCPRCQPRAQSRNQG